jgi:hypothetical protein
VPDQAQAGVVGLHHHVEQDAAVAPRLQPGPRLVGGVGRIELQRAIEQHHTAQGEHGGAVDFLVVVDDQDRPGVDLGQPCRRGDVAVVGELEQVVLMHHGRLPRPLAMPAAARWPAARGKDGAGPDGIPRCAVPWKAVP